MKNKLSLIILLFVLFAKVGVAQEVTMFPGFFGTKYYQDDVQISKQQAESLMLADKDADQLWQKSKQHLTIAWLAVGAEVGFLIWQLNRSSNMESQTGPFVGVLVTAGAAIGFSLSANSLRRDAILQYNSSRDLGVLRFGVTQNGLGLALNF